MVLEAAVHPQCRQVTMLQKIIRAKHQRRGLGQLRSADAIRKMPGDKRRAGQRPVTHGAQQHAAGPGDRPFTGTQAGSHFTGAHALEANGLILNHQVQQQVLLGAKIPHGRRPPGGQAVGIQGDAQALGQTFIVQRRHRTLQVTLQQTHLLYMVEQAPADFGRAWRRSAYQHRLADTGFKQFDALGDGRLGQPKHLRRPFKTGLFHNGGQGREQLIVEHQFS